LLNYKAACQPIRFSVPRALHGWFEFDGRTILSAAASNLLALGHANDRAYCAKVTGIVKQGDNQIFCRVLALHFAAKS
jgi:hypothetical protein